MPEKTYQPQFLEEVINSLKARPARSPNRKGTTDYFTSVWGSRVKLSEAQMYEFWLKGKHQCPHCDKWHKPGTRHRNSTDAEIASIDAAMAQRHEDELAKRAAKGKK